MCQYEHINITRSEWMRCESEFSKKKIGLNMIFCFFEPQSKRKKKKKRFLQMTILIIPFCLFLSPIVSMHTTSLGIGGPAPRPKRDPNAPTMVSSNEFNKILFM